jgi:hypothetical protein
MKITELTLTYDYSPYRSQEDQEIPAYEIFDQEGEKVADTNENQPAGDQEAIAALLAASPRLLRVLEAAQCKNWVHNVALTDDIEALRSICLHYGRWWNEQAMPAIAEARSGEEP